MKAQLDTVAWAMLCLRQSFFSDKEKDQKWLQRC